MGTSLTNPELVFATDQAIIAARGELAKVKLFSSNFSQEAAQPGSSMKVPIFLAGAAKVFNKETSNYEDASGTVVWPEIKFDVHVHSTWKFDDKDTLLTNVDLWRNAGMASGEAIAQALLETVVGGLGKATVPTTGYDPNYTDANPTSPTGKTDQGVDIPKFTANNEVVFKSATGSTLKKQLALLRATAKKVGIKPGRSVVCVSSDCFAEILDLLDSNVYGGTEAIRSGVIPGLFGWKGIVEVDEWADDNQVGAVVQEDCLAIAGRRIEPGTPGAYAEVGVTTDEASGLVLTTRRHGDPAKGDNFGTIEALFGYKVIQPTKVVRLVSQATAQANQSSGQGG